LLLATSYAQIPHLINYQGKLTDSSGNPVPDGTHSITFRIYNLESGGDILWQETQNLLISKGIFSCLLGGVTELNLAFDQPYWLAIKVGSDSEMTPRQQLASMGYAIRAEKANLAELATNAVNANFSANSDKLDGLDFSEHLNEHIGILTGTLSSGQIIPLPSGFSEEQCKWIISLGGVSGLVYQNFAGVKCWTEGRRGYCEECGTNDCANAPFNYIIIGVK